MTYAVCCKNCGNVEKFAYYPDSDEKNGGKRIEPPVPLTPRGHVPAYCLKCGNRAWRVPATAEDIQKFDAKTEREARAGELCRTLNMEGLFKIPDEIKGPSELKNALSNLLAPLEGEILKQAQANVIKASKSGVAAPTEIWVELYDRAVQMAVKPSKPMAKAS